MFDCQGNVFELQSATCQNIPSFQAIPRRNVVPISTSRTGPKRRLVAISTPRFSKSASSWKTLSTVDRWQHLRPSYRLWHNHWICQHVRMNSSLELNTNRLEIDKKGIRFPAFCVLNHIFEVHSTLTHHLDFIMVYHQQVCMPLSYFLTLP